jgi:DNA-binding MarR family transcriptional regulator
VDGDRASRPGWQAVVLLLMALRVVTEGAHSRLGQLGHPGTRPAHAFAFQAIGADGTTAGELARALGITKQAAAKMTDELETAGYIARTRDPSDGRRKLIVLTPRAVEFLELSAVEFDAIAERWRETVGERHFERLLDDLEKIVRASRDDGSLPPLRPIW